MLRASWWCSSVLHPLVACWQRQWGDLCLRLSLVDKERYLLQLRVVYCVVTNPAPSQRHDKIGMMTARHRVRPCRYRDGGGKWGNFIVTRGRPRWISHGHVS